MLIAFILHAVVGLFFYCNAYITNNEGYVDLLEHSMDTYPSVPQVLLEVGIFCLVVFLWLPMLILYIIIHD